MSWILSLGNYKLYDYALLITLFYYLCVLGLVSGSQWDQVAELFLQIPVKNYCELNKFTLKLFEIVTEEHRDDGTVLADDTFLQFMKEIKVG